MSRDNRANFLAELARISPQVERAFLAAVQDVRSTAQMAVIEAAIKRGVETGDVATAVREVMTAIQLGYEFWAPLDKTIGEAFEAGAVWQISNLPKKPLRNTGPFVVRFQGRHPRAEAWSRTTSAQLITEINRDTEKVVRAKVAHAVETSRPYRKTARELVGRIEGNQRKGGLIGLHSRQAGYVERMRGILEDPEAMAATFRGKRDNWPFTRRDRRLDGRIAAAVKAGRSLSSDDIDAITRRYADRLLQRRGKTIARTESNKAMNAGRAESVVQMVESGKIPADAVTKIWDATPGRRTRESHRALSGTAVRWGEKFVSPVTGAEMDWPHDESAPAAEVVNCRCSCRFRIDWKVVARWREGQLPLAA